MFKAYQVHGIVDEAYSAHGIVHPCLFHTYLVRIGSN